MNRIIAIAGKKMPVLLSLVVGGVAGWLYWKFIGCSSGTCYIQSNPYRMTFYGVFLGGLIYYSINQPKQNKVVNSTYLFAVILFISMSISVNAQQSGKILFTTSVGVINGQGNFGKAFKSTVAFNSGVELTMKNKWFGQFVFDFNALKYDQQIKDATSPFLFQNTNSSLLLLGINGGKDFYFHNKKWFTSLYGGGGYLNIGEPRITIDNSLNLAKQNNVRKNSVFARIGTRLAYITKSSFFQTVYIDGSYWTSPAKVQGGTVNGLSFYLGTRFGIQ